MDEAYAERMLRDQYLFTFLNVCFAIVHSLSIMPVGILYSRQLNSLLGCRKALIKKCIYFLA